MILSEIPRPRIKYTVLKVPKPSEIWGTKMPDRTTYGEKDEACPLFHVGQEIIVDGFRRPKGFCAYVWSETWWHRQVLGGGGSFSSPVYPAPSIPPDEYKVLYACSDGIRPVIFKIEKI